jgi:hypothetical protein
LSENNLIFLEWQSVSKQCKQLQMHWMTTAVKTAEVGFEQPNKISAAEIFENGAKTESKFSKGLGAASKLALLL